VAEPGDGRARPRWRWDWEKGDPDIIEAPAPTDEEPVINRDMLLGIVLIRWLTPWPCWALLSWP